MRIVRVEETVQNQGHINLHHLTDLHLGAPDFVEEAFRERVKMIEDDPWSRWTMGGDVGDLIKHNDRRYAVSELAPRYRQATDIVLATQQHAVELLKPIADKCVGWSDGNHEKKVDDTFGGHFGPEMCTRLGIERRFVDYRGFVYLSYKIMPRGAYVSQLIDLQHGWQAGRSDGAFVNQCRVELGMTTADIVLRGHNHKPASHTFVTLDVNNNGNKIIQRPRTVVNGGCWRTGYRDNLAAVSAESLHETERSMWSETKGFRIEPVGGPVLRLGFEAGWGESKSNRKSRSCAVSHTVINGNGDLGRLLGL